MSQLNSEIINETAKGDLFINLDTYLENPEEFLNSLTNSSSDYLGGALYVAGYIAYKIKQEINCKECIGLIIQDDWDLKNGNLIKHPNLNDFKFDVEQDFAQKIDIGKLSKPTTILFSIVEVCIKFFDLHIRPLIGIEVKNPSSEQLRNLLIKFLFD